MHKRWFENKHPTISTTIHSGFVGQYRNVSFGGSTYLPGQAKNLVLGRGRPPREAMTQKQKQNTGIATILA